MKGLYHYQRFDHEAFFGGLVMVYLGTAEWREFVEEGEGKPLGTKVKVLIVGDNNEYGERLGKAANAMETLFIKCPGRKAEDYSDFTPAQTVVRVVDVQRATVWGEYNQNLSVIAQVEAVRSK